MDFVTVREFRTQPAKVWKKLESGKELVVTRNGKPFALLTRSPSAPVSAALPARVREKSAEVRVARAYCLPCEPPQARPRSATAVQTYASTSLDVPSSKKMRTRPVGRSNVATTVGLVPRNAWQMRSYRVSKVIPEYTSPVITRSGLTYSCGLRGVPLGVRSVTKTTARMYLESPSLSVWTGGGKNDAYGSPSSYPLPGLGEPICGGTPCAVTVIHSHPG